MDATNIEMYPKVKSSKLTTSWIKGRMLSDPPFALRMFGVQENIPGRPGTRKRDAGILRPTFGHVTCIRRRYIFTKLLLPNVHLLNWSALQDIHLLQLRVYYLNEAPFQIWIERSRKYTRPDLSTPHACMSKLTPSGINSTYYINKTKITWKKRMYGIEHLLIIG